MIPILYESTWISIQTLWVFVVIALLISSYLAVERLRRERVNFTLLIEHSTFFLICGLIGSRLTYFLFHTDAYIPGFDLRTLINFFSIWDQGFSFWGAAVAIGLALYYRLRKEGEELSKWADALVIPMFTGLIIGDLGTFLSGYSYGTPTDLPWGVLYESYNVKYTVPVHPTQLYSLLLLIVLLWSKKQLAKKSHFFQKSGNTALYLLTSFAFCSFFLEFLRGDDTLLILGIRVPTLLYLSLFCTAGWALYKRYKLYKHGSAETL
jgi:phosphatidylglycerol:prolipoprotein diacylglycerol transferase